MSLEKQFLTKVIGKAAPLNQKKSLEKRLLTKVVGGAVIFNPKKSLEKQFLTKVVGVGFLPKQEQTKFNDLRRAITEDFQRLTKLSEITKKFTNFKRFAFLTFCDL